MKYVKTFESFNQNFKINDIVVCIDAKFMYYNLTVGDKYKIIEPGSVNVKVKDLKTGVEEYLAAKRFVSEQDYELYNNTKKYNL